MAKKIKKFKPPTLIEVQEYIDFKGYHLVNAAEFCDYYEALEWHDQYDKPIRVWKGKLVQWFYREKLWLKEQCVYLRCRFINCGKDGVYVVRDDTGQQSWWCWKHRPIPKPIISKAQADNMLKKVEDGNKQSKSDRVNELREGLGL